MRSTQTRHSHKIQWSDGRNIHLFKAICPVRKFNTSIVLTSLFQKMKASHCSAALEPKAVIFIRVNSAIAGSCTVHQLSLISLEDLRGSSWIMNSAITVFMGFNSMSSVSQLQLWLMILCHLTTLVISFLPRRAKTVHCGDLCLRKRLQSSKATMKILLRAIR